MSPFVPLSFLTRVLIPSRCQLCESVLSLSEQSLCQLCMATLPRVDRLAGEKLTTIAPTIALNSTFQAALYFNEPVQTLCYSLKYGSNPRLARTLGRQLLAPKVAHLVRPAQPVVLCPMPIHARRRLKRGYNQSEELAKGCARGLREQGVTAHVGNLLAKAEHRKSQVNFGNFERWSNTQNAFAASKKQQRIPKDALLFIIDDTVTTGSSLLRAGEALKTLFPENGVHLLALAVEI